MKYAVCTSFNDAGYELYGKEFLRTYLANWQVPLWVFYEGRKPDIIGPHYIDLLADPDLCGFLAKFGKHPRANGIIGERDGKPIIDYRYQAVKFAKKVFAYTSPVRPDVDWWIWLDADTVTTAPITEDFLAAVCPDGFLGSYLGRKDWHHSECGWVALNKRYGADEFLKRYREIYTSEMVFMFMEWHDSFIFDALRKEFSCKGSWFYNLSNDVPGNHVWPDSMLGKVLMHHKGPVAKKDAYAGK